MTYYLLDHPNPNGQHYSTSRNGVPIRGIVIHTAENVADTIGPDGGAESVANYGATAARSVSWHATVDKDSIIPMLPDHYKAYHVIGYNESTLGIEQACQASGWATYPPDWVSGVLSNAAEVVRGWCVAHNIPVKRISKAEYDAGGSGILAHADLDPSRRSDPGVGFPWDRFLNIVKEGVDVMTSEEIAAIAKAAAAAVWDSKLGASSGNISMATAVQRTYMASLEDACTCECVCNKEEIADAVADKLAVRLGS
jgi:hypothetical protein